MPISDVVALYSMVMSPDSFAPVECTGSHATLLRYAQATMEEVAKVYGFADDKAYLNSGMLCIPNIKKRAFWDRGEIQDVDDTQWGSPGNSDVDDDFYGAREYEDHHQLSSHCSPIAKTIKRAALNSPSSPQAKKVKQMQASTSIRITHSLGSANTSTDITPNRRSDRCKIKPSRLIKDSD
jgi:hypothetical protein